jgi:hypothetical protein
MAVLSQVRVAVASYNQAISEFKTANEMTEVEYEILSKIRADVQSGSGGARDVIRTEMQALLSELRQDIAFSSVRSAVGRMYVSIGADPLPETVQSHDLKDIASAFKKVNDDWFRGRFDLADPITLSQQDDEAVSVAADEKPSADVSDWFASLFNNDKAN